MPSLQRKAVAGLRGTVGFERGEGGSDRDLEGRRKVSTDCPAKPRPIPAPPPSHSPSPTPAPPPPPSTNPSPSRPRPQSQPRPSRAGHRSSAPATSALPEQSPPPTSLQCALRCCCCSARGPGCWDPWPVVLQACPWAPQVRGRQFGGPGSEIQTQRTWRGRTASGGTAAQGSGVRTRRGVLRSGRGLERAGVHDQRTGGQVSRAR